MKPWFKALCAAFISGAAHAIVVAGVLPSMLGSRAGLANLAEVAAASGLISASMYLTKSPFPGLPQPSADQTTKSNP